MEMLLHTENAKLLPQAYQEKEAYSFEGMNRNTVRLLFLASFTINFMTGLLLYFVFYIGNGDAVSRTANAYYVLFSREPHLAAIGFVWPPLPSLLQIPLMPLFRLLSHPWLTGPFLSSIFGAISLVIFYVILGKFQLPQVFRWMFLGLVQFNILFLYLSSSGMAEPIALCFILTTIWGYLEIDKTLRSWVICGLSLCFAFFVRYEAIALMAGVVVALMIFELGQNKNWKVELEGRTLAILVPFAYSVGLWMFFNWIIMDTPTYFLASIYSLSNAPDTAKVFGMMHPYYLAWNNLFEAIWVAVQRTWSQSPLFALTLIPTFLLSWKQRNYRFLGLTIILISIPSFTTLQVFLGSLASWFRYWFYVVPFGFILAGMFYSMLEQHTLKKLVLWFAIFAGLFSYPLTLSAMSQDDVGRDEQRIQSIIMGDNEKDQQLKYVDGYWIFRHDAPIVSKALDYFSEKGLVLVDASRGYANIMTVNHPERLLISSDLDFYHVLEEPASYIRYILMLDPKDSDGINIITMTWPELVSGDAPWASLVWESEDTLATWRIFELNHYTEK